MLNFETSNNLENYNQDLLLAWLSTQISLTFPRLQLIQGHYPNLRQGLEDGLNKLRQLPKTDWLNKLTLANLTENLTKFGQQLQTQEIRIISYLNPDYPQRFQALNEPPLVLYYQGRLELTRQKQILTVVGSRTPNLYAKQLLKQILTPACQLGVGVVSGLAYGIDTLAHQTAVDHQAPNVAVIGSGLDQASFYPSQNWHLKNQMLEASGLILSEYPPGTPPNNYNFPRRNRLLAALSELTWVVQAGGKSGSLITAEAANELGKTVATTPASILDELFGGNLKLLKNGANLISEPEDILQLLGLSSHVKIAPRHSPEFASPAEKAVWQALTLEPQLAETLALGLKMDIQQLHGLLTMLELQNLAICTGENLWIRG